MKVIRLAVIFLVLCSFASCSYIKEKKEQWFGDDDVTEISPTVVESNDAEEVVAEEVVAEEVVVEEDLSTETVEE